MASRNVLVVTLPPFAGGVPTKTRLLCHHLQSRGHHVTVAWYATFAHDPDLNIPSWKLFGGRQPGCRSQPAFDIFPGRAVGTWLPELEAPYYRLSRHWRGLIDAHDRHIAVAGPPLVGNILARAGVPFWLWCASDVLADRHDRQGHMPWYRAVIDTIVTRPWLLAQQSYTLSRCPLALGVSSYTVDQLLKNGADPGKTRRLPIPVDGSLFTPAPAPERDIIGFAARFEDPRKNVDLLLCAMAQLRRRRNHARLKLAGAAPSAATLARVAELGLTDHVDFVGEVPLAQLPDFYRSLDVFALPSWQEGLCIAGIEAMSCGVPVVSTPCGGPLDYVRPGISGYLCDWDDASMAAALDRALAERGTLSAGALQIAARDFSMAAFVDGVAAAWHDVWGDTP